MKTIAVISLNGGCVPEDRLRVRADCLADSDATSSSEKGNLLGSRTDAAYEETLILAGIHYIYADRQDQPRTRPLQHERMAGSSG